MRKIFITIALFAVLGTLAVSCQKENIIDETSIVAENGKVVTYPVTYIPLIDNEIEKEFPCVKE
ncbi:MAG: hypothetical protein Q4D03_08440 [Bacteroidales bacterium]|nr:hypothetical protein [Bacteroidales bacterium]